MPTRILCFLAFGLANSVLGSDKISGYQNPILPGWHSDPSCTFIQQWNETFFCTTSSFLAFPGIPVYASKDLIHWKIASHALSRSTQLPQLATASYQSDGIYASTIRFHNGTLFIVTAFLSGYTVPRILVFTTTDPYDKAAWGDPIDIPVDHYGYDPDLFWNDDETMYLTYAAYNDTYNTEIMQASVNLAGRSTGPWRTIWTGTGAPWPEGPHLYSKNGFYYLVIAEGGTGLNHSVTIARATNVDGPFESYLGNPILTANDTDAYFQTVGHADLLQDGKGKWWGVALATRSGPEWEVFPMGRETVLFQVTWRDGEWPELTPVNGSMIAPLPIPDRDLPISGPFIDSDEMVDFLNLAELPSNFLTWRPQSAASLVISPSEKPHSLKLMPSYSNLTASGSSNTTEDTSLTFISRLQTSTLFSFSVDISFSPLCEEAEAGITVFLNQLQHIDLGIVLLASGQGLTPTFRLRVESSGRPDIIAQNATLIPIPSPWLSDPIRLLIDAVDDRTFQFSAASMSNLQNKIVVGKASAKIVSGGIGKFTGSLLGSYATSNGGTNTSPSYLENWTYTSIAQEIARGEFAFSDA